MRSMLLVGIVMGCASVAGAQARSAAPAALSTVAVLRLVDERVEQSDSLGALAVLDSALARDRKNGPLWHRYGRIAWGMSKTEKGPVMRPEMIRLRMRADSAMRYAMAFSPDSAQYFLDMGHYALETNIVFVRVGAKGNFEDGVKVARAQRRDPITAELLDGIGMIAWRDYDIVNHRAVEKSADEYASTPSPRAPTEVTYESVQPGQAIQKVGPSTAVPASVFRGDFAKFYGERLSLVMPITGEASFATALNHFRDAFALDSGNARVRRHIYMAFADHQSWRDLLSSAERALRVDDADVDAWLARGVATSSLEDYDAAAAAFDNALRRMTSAERASFTDVRRALPPYTIGKAERFADTLRWAGLSPAERRRQETLFWSLADPRPSTRVNEGMVEYFARIAYADLRFGNEDFRIRGADSPRGDTWIRYGKPDFVYSVPREGGVTNVIWVYQKLQLAFVFDMRANFGNARYAFDQGPAMDSIHAEHPIGWDNLPLARRTWPMRLRVARFRSSADSMDAVVTATVPVRSFLEGAELKGPMPIAVQLDVHDPAARIVGREMRTVNVNSDSLPVGINGAWVRRLGRGPNVVRVDAEQRDVRRSASANVDAIVDSSSGFGISDLLLGTNPTVATGKSPARWTDVSIAPTTGVFPWSQSVGVVWESYDLAPQEGSVRYKVHVNLQRTFKSNVIGFIARIAAYSRNVVQRDGSATGSVSVDYEQVRAAAPTITDFLSINLNGSVTGTYRLTIEIEDLVAKRTVRRSTTLELTKD